MNILIGFLVILGALVIFASAVGVYRLPDAYCRNHALGKGLTLGISLLLIGYGLHMGTMEAGIKVLIALAFQFFTIPLAGHLLSLIAFRNRLTRWKERPDDPQPD